MPSPQSVCDDIIWVVLGIPQKGILRILQALSDSPTMIDFVQRPL